MGNATSEGHQNEHALDSSLNLDELLKHADTYTEEQLHQTWDTGQLPTEDTPKFFQAARSLKSWTSSLAQQAVSKWKPCDDSCPYTSADAEQLELPYISLQEFLHIRGAHPLLYKQLQTATKRLHRFRSEANRATKADEHEDEDESKEEPEGCDDDNGNNKKANFLTRKSHSIKVQPATQHCAEAEACTKYKELLAKYHQIHDAEPDVDRKIFDHCLVHHVKDIPSTQCQCDKWDKDSTAHQHIIHGHWYHCHTQQQLLQEEKQKKKRKENTAPIKYKRASQIGHVSTASQSARLSLKIRIPRTETLKNILSAPEFKFGAPFQINEEHEAKFKNPKEEMLRNSYHALTVTLWTVLLRKCILYAKTGAARRANINVKEIVALKLYTDYDALQREYRTCFRETEDNGADIARQRQFYHWNNLLQIACNKSMDTVTEPLYHGISGNFRLSSFTGTYYGPVSTTTVLSVAQQFAGAHGKILELYPSFGKRGLRVDWLSNFPDEQEILYMNTTFQIRKMYKPGQPVTPKTPVLGGFNVNNERQAREFEKAVMTAIQSINVHSTVLCLNTKHSEHDESKKDDDTSGFVELSSRTQLAVLYLLYLQYRQDAWNEFIQKSDSNVRKAFTAFRKEFVVLAENVRAIKMEQLSKPLQVFFYTEQEHYRFPIDLYGEDETNQQKQDEFKFQSNQPIRIETVVRLFPNAEQISINATNWDFSLNTFISWLQTFDMDYVDVKLQDIYIKFANKKKIDGSKRIEYEIVTDDERAKSLLNAKAGATAQKQLTTLRKLGWQLITHSHLHRVGFEPAPELPFVMVFVKPSENTRLFYQSYAMQFTSQQVRGFGDLVDEAFEEQQPGSHATEPVQPGLPINMTKSTAVEELEGDHYVVVHHNPANCILSENIFNALEYKDELTELLKFRKEHWMEDSAEYQYKNKKKSKFIELCEMVETLVLGPMPSELKEVFMEYPKKETTKRGIISFEAIYRMFPNVEEIFLRDTTLTLRICYKLIDFEQKYGEKRKDEDNPLKLKRIFFRHRDGISDDHVMRLQSALRPHAWEMVQSVSMLQRT